METKEKHPSGLSMERWNWPFKTPQERKLVAKYFSKTDKEKLHNNLGKGLF